MYTDLCRRQPLVQPVGGTARSFARVCALGDAQADCDECSAVLGGGYLDRVDRSDTGLRA